MRQSEKARVNRHREDGGSGTRAFEWAELLAWLRENSNWDEPERAQPAPVFGSMRKQSARPQSKLISGHNKKLNCRHRLPNAEEASYVVPAIQCDQI